MVNRRSKKLDALIGKAVEIIFLDDSEAAGVLEYGQPKFYGLPESDMYSVYVFGGRRYFFRKTHVKEIHEWRENG